MRVIKNGVVIVKDCSKCNSTLEISPSDIHYCDVGGGITATCAVCGGIMNFTLEEWPD